MKYLSFGAFKGTGFYKVCLVFVASLTLIQAILVGWGVKEHRWLWQVFFAEDMAYEYLTAAFYVLAAIFMMRIMFTGPISRRYRFFIIAFAVLFIFIAMEEISWGQRIFEAETPDWLADANQQEEINIHNLHTDIFHVLMWGGSLLLGVLLPLLYKTYTPVQRLAKRFSFPVMSPDFHFFFLLPITYYVGHTYVYMKLISFIASCFILFLFFNTSRARCYVDELPPKWGKYLILSIPILSLLMFQIHRYMIPMDDDKAGQEATEMLLSFAYLIFAWAELKKARVKQANKS